MRTTGIVLILAAAGCLAAGPLRVAPTPNYVTRAKAWWRSLRKQYGTREYGWGNQQIRVMLKAARKVDGKLLRYARAHKVMGREARKLFGPRPFVGEPMRAVKVAAREVRREEATAGRTVYRVKFVNDSYHTWFVAATNGKIVAVRTTRHHYSVSVGTR